VACCIGSDAMSSGLIHWLHVHVVATGGVARTGKHVKCTSVAYLCLIRGRTVGHDSKEALHGVASPTWKPRILVLVSLLVILSVVVVYLWCLGCYYHDYYHAEVAVVCGIRQAPSSIQSPSRTSMLTTIIPTMCMIQH